jgi:hypothetical protein
MTELDRRIVAAEVPDSLRGVLLDFPWDLNRLFALDLPTEDLALSPFLWLLDLPFWREDGEWFVLTPNQVRTHPTDHQVQWNRTQQADLREPIHVVERAKGPVIIDGIHRLLRAEIEGRTTLPARRVPSAMLPKIAANQ